LADIRDKIFGHVLMTDK